MDRKARYMRQTCDELRRAAENELHFLAQGRGLLLEGDDGQARDVIPSMPMQSATTYMVTPEMARFEAGSNIDGFSGGSMVFPSAVVGMNDIFDAPLLYQLSHPLHGAVDQPSLFRASGQT
ncbi:hypothetical protein BCR34DRAFT_463072, partial [Clohesyomyces aquaticus]